MRMETILFAIIGSLLILTGLVGTILPVLPGLPIAWLGFFIYAIGTHFERISITALIVFSAITALIMLLDFVAPLLGAKKYRASKYGILGAFLGTILGIIVFGFWGIILGPFLGAFLLELVSNRRPQEAFKSAFGTFVGFVIGSLIKIILILTMGGFFVASLF